MKLAIDQAIEFSLDEFLIQRAEECINQIRGDYKQRGDDEMGGGMLPIDWWYGWVKSSGATLIQRKGERP